MGRRRQAGRAEAGEEAGDEAWRAVFGGLEGHGGVGADTGHLLPRKCGWATAAQVAAHCCRCPGVPSAAAATL